MDKGAKMTSIPVTTKQIQDFVDSKKDYHHYLGIIVPYRPGVKICFTRVEYELFTPDTEKNDMFHMYILNWKETKYAMFSVPSIFSSQVEKIATECGIKLIKGFPLIIDGEGFHQFPIHSDSLFHMENTKGHIVYENKQLTIDDLMREENEKIKKIIDDHLKQYQLLTFFVDKGKGH